MIIRKATLQDSEIITEHMLLAMQDIAFEFIGTKDIKKAKAFLQHFVKQKNSQYSYINCFVVLIKNEIVGTVNIYDGAQLKTLRKPIATYIQTQFETDFNPEEETQAGEYYIDTIGVSTKCQGKGIGTKLLKFIIETYVIDHKQTIGLLVDEENPKAEKLYLNLGFEIVGSKSFLGKQMKHLQIKP